MEIIFTYKALQDLQKFKFGNQKLAFKVFELIDDIQKQPFAGLGKPEPLKGDYQGFWSRRIDEEHRLIYRIKDNSIEIIACHGHYSDK